MRITKIMTDDEKYYLELRDGDKNLFGVFNKFGSRLSRNGEWDYEMLPSSRTDIWIKKHSFSYQEALDKLKMFEESK